MYTLIINSLQLSNCVFILKSSDPTEFSFMQSKHVQQTFLSNYSWQCIFSPNLQGPWLCGNNQQEQGHQGSGSSLYYFPFLPFVVWLQVFGC